MGLFSNLLNGVKSAGMWALNHSGDIAGVVDAVAQVAGVLEIPRDTPRLEDAHSDNLNQFHQNFAAVSRKLEKTARKSAAVSSKELHSHDKQTILTDSVTGIWKDPVGLTPASRPTQTMYEDLSRFLGQMNVPTAFPKKDDPNDVVHQLGSALFKLKDPSKIGSHPDTLSTKLEVPGGVITAAHTYYYLPMGHAGAQNSVHSAVAVKYATTEANQKQYLLNRSNVTYTSSAMNMSGWLITLNVHWSDTVQASTVQKGAKGFASIFSKQYRDLKIVTSQVMGTLQLLKVNGPPTTTPAAVKAAVQYAANAALPDSPFAFLDPAPQATRNVPVEVLNSAFVLPAGSSVAAEAAALEQLGSLQDEPMVVVIKESTAEH